MIKPVTIKDLHQSVRGVLGNVLGRYSVYACPVATDDEDHQIFILQHSTPQTTENRYWNRYTPLYIRHKNALFRLFSESIHFWFSARLSDQRQRNQNLIRKVSWLKSTYRIWLSHQSGNPGNLFICFTRIRSFAKTADTEKTRRRWWLGVFRPCRENTTSRGAGTRRNGVYRIGFPWTGHGHLSSNVRIVGSGSRDHLSIFDSKNPSFCISCPGTRPQRPAENKIMRNFSRIDLHFRNPNGRLQHGTGNIRSRRSVVEMVLLPVFKRWSFNAG